MTIFSFKDYNTLVSESLTDLAAQTDITQLNPGAKARSILEVVNSRLAAAYQYVDERMANALLASAAGPYLDFMGDLFACPRRGATFATANSGADNVCFYVASGTFGDLNNGNSIVVPDGTAISSVSLDGDPTKSITYTTDMPETLPADANQLFVSVTANMPGTSSIVGSDVLTSHNLKGFPGLLVKNVVPIANAVDIETDDAYRYRLSKVVTSSAEANRIAVRLACLSVPGVSDILEEPYARGSSTFDIYVLSQTGQPSQPLLELVQQQIDYHQGYGIIGKARTPVTVGLQFQAQVYPVRPLTSIEVATTTQTLTQAASRYMANFRIGGSLLINNLLATLVNASVLIQTIGQPGKPFSQLFIWKPSRTNNGRKRYTLTGNYNTAFNEIVQMEIQDGLASADFRFVS